MRPRSARCASWTMRSEDRSQVGIFRYEGYTWDKAQGSVMLLLGIAMMLLSSIALAIVQTQLANQQLSSLLTKPSKQQAGLGRDVAAINRQNCVDEVIHQLHAYLSIQGYSNPGQFGRLPYPNDRQRIAGGFMGKPPRMSELHGGGMVHGLASHHPLNESDPACRDQLVYAVASIATNDADLDLLDPASLDPGSGSDHVHDGGGDWWTAISRAASLTLAPNTQTNEQIVAVVAEHLELTPAGRLQAFGAFEVMTVSRWQSLLARKATMLFANTTQRVLPVSQAKINQATSNQATSRQALTSQTFTRQGCECECTRRRCRCQCNEGDETHWQSSQAGSQCLPSSTGRCQNKLTTPTGQNRPISQCSAKPGEWCDFNAAASLVSGWPITRWQPQTHVDSACSQRQNAAPLHVCPLAAPDKNTSCRCTFDWPISLQSRHPDRFARLIAIPSGKQMRNESSSD